MRWLLLVAAVCTCSGVLAGGAGSAAPKLDKIVLRPGQVGAGYKLVMRSDGRCLQGCVTLDLCGSNFPSEKLRTARLQVNYRLTGKPVVSNEVVTYRPGGAAQALREITHAATHCPTGPIPSPVAGVSEVTFRVQRITDPHLLPGYLAVRVHFTEEGRGRRYQVDGVGVYQFRHNVFSGVYTNFTRRRPIAPQQRLAMHAAEQSAANLKRAA
jgi:hypothetical protein